MKDVTIQAAIALACTLLVFAAGASAEGVKGQSRGGKEKGDESWEIEQRQRWWIQSRELDRTPNASQLRRQAVQALKFEKQQRAALDRASNNVWTELGPSSMKMGSWTMGRVAGRINAIDVHPQSEDTVLIGTANGGVWKTTNAGASWTPLFTEMSSQAIGAVHIEKTAPQNIWVGTGDRFNGRRDTVGECASYLSDGVFLSTDSGVTWTGKNGSGTSRLKLDVVNSVTVLPGNSNVILAGGLGDRCTGSNDGAGLYRSTDRGASWTSTFNDSVEDIVALGNVVYLSAPGKGVYKSGDGGVTWTSASSGLTAGGTRLRLAIAPSDPATLYALDGNGALYRTSNGGTSWTRRNNNVCESACYYNLALAVHPTNPNTILTATIRPALSTDGGTSIKYLTATWGSSQTVHQDIHALYFSRSNGSRYWVGGDGGLWRTDNNGTAWANMNSNLNIMQFYDVAVHPTNADIVFGGAQDNSSSRRTSSNVWDLTFVNGDGFMNAIDESNANVVFQAGYPSGSSPSIYRSTQGGAPNTFSMITSGLSGTWPWVTPLASAGGYVYVAGSGVYRSGAAGSISWSNMSGAFSGSAKFVTATKVGSEIHVYAGTTNGDVFYTANGASGTLAKVTGNLPTGSAATDVAVDPGNGRRAFVTRGGFTGARLYRTSNAGGTWEAVGNGLPNIPTNTVAIDPLDPQRIFVGNDVGVYESRDGGANFYAFSTGLPNGLIVADLEVDNNPHVLVAGTYGRGAWKIGLAGSTNQLPVAGFEFDSSEPLKVKFTDASTDSDGTVVQYNWNFGDGSNSTERNPVKTYARAGNYSVTLTVTDDKGGVDTETKSVTVIDESPGNVLENNKPLTELSGEAGSDRVWRMEVPAGTTSLKFSASGGSGDADLYVKFGSAPTTADYDCRPYTGSNNEVCDIANIRAGTYYVMLRGYRAYSGLTLLGSYSGDTGVKTYANENDFAVIDNATVESPIAVSGRSGNASATTKVAVVIVHPYIGDLKVELIAADGTAYVLHNRSGGSTDNIDQTYTVDLSSKPLNGEWKLRVYDAAKGDSGRIDRWSITF